MTKYFRTSFPILKTFTQTSAFLFSIYFFMADASAQTVLLQDDFNSSVLNSQNWKIGNWRLGRTQLGNTPVFGLEGTTSFARLTFDTYQFKGTEIYSLQSFSRGNGLEIEARVRLNNLPSGLVTSLFTYVYDAATATSDEIEIGRAHV